MKIKDLLTEDIDVEKYAADHDLGDISWEGSGDMGEAYTTERDTILKITNDDTEIEFATMLVGKKLHNVVDIYDVSGNIIHMEYLDVDGIDDLYSSAMEYAEYGDITEIDVRDHEDMPDDVREFIENIGFGAGELSRAGVHNMDLKHDNIGQKSNGQYAIFDMSSHKGR
jgi:hypothetical protein